MLTTVIFDIDGVLTDGNVYIDPAGNETKRIAYDDIDAIFELKRRGLKIGFVSGEDGGFSSYVKKRFDPDFFIAGCKDKLTWFKGLEETKTVVRNEVCFVGDSLKDTELLEYIPLSYAPADVDPLVKSRATIITNANRGNGVVREVVYSVLAQNSQRNRETDPVIFSSIDDHLALITSLRDDDELIRKTNDAALLITESLRRGGRLLICGNGGSAADSQHLATELVSRFYLERKALDAEALTINTSSLTAIANDYEFDRVFSRQVEAKGRAGDVLLGISTSGNSSNVIQAINSAKSIGMATIAMTGSNSLSTMARIADVWIGVPSSDTPRIQEAHILIGHILCQIIERALSN
jgi:D-sedoheptulose 7-phosphate isomerase